MELGRGCVKAVGRAEGAAVAGGQGRGQKEAELVIHSFLYVTTETVRRLQCACRLLVLLKGMCVHSTDTRGESNSLYRQRHSETEVGQNGENWGGRMILRDKRGWGGDKQGERKVYTEI